MRCGKCSLKSFGKVLSAVKTGKRENVLSHDSVHMLFGIFAQEHVKPSSSELLMHESWQGFAAIISLCIVFDCRLEALQRAGLTVG